MKAAGAPDDYIRLGNCWNFGSATIGEDPALAKEYLRSILCSGGSYGGAGPDGTIYGINGRGGLNPGFAQCAASFLKSASQSGIPVCVREGFRTVAQQETYARDYRNGAGGIACTKGANCEHPRGIAIDVNTTTEYNYQRLHSLAGSFGLTFYLGFRDKVHFVPKKGGCNAGGTLPPDQVLPPDFYDYPQYAQSSPVDDISNAIRKMLGLQGQQQSQSSAPVGQPAQNSGTPASVGTPTTGGQSPSASPTACTPSYFCSGNTYYYKTSSCSELEIQTCQYGCANDACALPPVSSQINLTPGSTGDTSTSSPARSGTSTIDLILSYANPTPVNIGTATSIILNPDLGDISSALGGAPVPGQQTVQPPPRTVALQPLGTQQTFTSTDLANNSPLGMQNSYAFNVLEGMRLSLLRALEYLRPFGHLAPQPFVD